MRAWLLAALVCTSGCDSAFTEMVLTVTPSQLAIPGDVDALEIHIHDLTANLREVYSLSPQPLCPDSGETTGCLSTPVSLTMLPGSMGDQDQVEVNVRALKGGQPVIEQAATFLFVKGQRLRLAFYLYRACLGRLDCDDQAQARACGYDGQCYPITPEPLSSGSPDLSGAAPDMPGPPAPDMTAPPDMLSGPGLNLLAGAPGGLGYADGNPFAARFYAPSGMATDSSGNLYVADTTNEVIRKIQLATGNVSTLAGLVKTQGSADGVGSAARFHSPTDIVNDGAGNLYIADNNNDVIRRLALATGAVTTVAGSPGMSNHADGIGNNARFQSVTGLVSDGAGNLYITSGDTIRKMALSNNNVTTIVGSPTQNGSSDGTGAAAHFWNPRGLAIDTANGLLYVADTYNHTIRQITLSSGAVITYAGVATMTGSGNGMRTTARFNFPSGLLLLAGNLYVADSSNALIRRIDIGSDMVSTLAGAPVMAGYADGAGAAARFALPYGLTTDGAGNLYVSEQNNHDVRKIVAATGVVTTLAGVAPMRAAVDGVALSARFQQPAAVASDAQGNIYVADRGNSVIRKLDATAMSVTTLAGTAGVQGDIDGIGAVAGFRSPSGIACSGTELFVSDTNNHTIRKINLIDKAVTTLAGTAQMSAAVNGTGAAARFNSPWGIVNDGAGNLYVADSSNHTIRKIVIASGVVTTLAGTAPLSGSTDGTGAAARFNGPYGLALDGSGNLYVGENFGHVIRKINLTTAAVTTVAGAAGSPAYADGTGIAAQFRNPVGLVFSAGTLYIADAGNSAIRRFDPVSGAVTTWFGTPGQPHVQTSPLPPGLNTPHGLAVRPSGEIIITDFAENVILGAR